MNMSFYTAVAGVKSQQTKMDVVSNNIANVNTTGYKTKNAVFSELLYRNFNSRAEVETDLKAGTGVTVSSVNTNFMQSGTQETGNEYDFAILGSGFFMLTNPTTNEVSYTRDGRFQLSQRNDGFYLATTDGKLVLDTNRQPIKVDETNKEKLNLGVFSFTNTNGMQSIGDNEFIPVEKNGQPQLNLEATIQQGNLELSGVELSQELGKVIESQRAYSMALKMVQTQDEITGTINSLR